MDKILLYLLPVSVGLATVLQGGINRKIAIQWGLLPAILMNTIILFICVSAALAYTWKSELNGGSEIFKINSIDWSKIKIWFLLPGILGFLILCAIPFTIAKIGALQVFVMLVLGQMIASMLWDYFAESTTITLYRILGVFFVALGVWLASLKSL